MTRPPIRADLAAMTGYHSPQVEVDVRLNTNESPWPPPPEFAAAVATAARSLDWHRYPDRRALALRRAVAARFGLGPEQVFCANGSNEVLQTLLLTFAGSGRTTLTFEPTYALHSHLSRISGAVVVQAERGEGFALSAERARAEIESVAPSVTFLCSPNNPTGLVESPQTVSSVLDAVESINGLLVVDEAYGEFASWSAVELLAEERPLVVVKTFSKTWSMAAARLGYLLGPRWLVEELEAVVLPYHLDGLKQAAGVAALQFSGEMHARVAAVVEERARVSSCLVDLGCHVWPSGANFVLFRPPPAGSGFVWQALVDRSVLVRDTSSWRYLDGCLRVTIGTPEENSVFLGALADILDHDE
jgi:histidinol-phosphate aminotransferase